MKPAAFVSALFLVMGTTAHSQWSLLPLAGIEKPQSSLYVNDQKAISSLGGDIAFKGILRADYRFKGSHGPYASVGSSPAAIRVSFSDPENIVNNYVKETSGLQWRLEGGYGLSTKPIYFKKGAAKSTASKTSQTKTYTTVVKKSCGSYTYTYRCQRSTATQKTAKNTAFNMRLQPAVGMAYLPAIEDDVVQDGASTLYRAGNWNTAFVSSLGFELAKGAHRFLTLQLSYTKGIGNLGTNTISTVVDGKNVFTSLRSNASSWGLTAGIPIMLTKKTTQPVKREVKKEVEQVEKVKTYKRCGRTVI